MCLHYKSGKQHYEQSAFIFIAKIIIVELQVSNFLVHS